jgi:hypothetical protein
MGRDGVRAYKRAQGAPKQAPYHPPFPPKNSHMKKMTKPNLDHVTPCAIMEVCTNWKCTWSTLHASTDKNYTKLWQKWAFYSFKYLPVEGLTLNRMVFKQLYKVNCCIPHLRPWVPREGLANKWFTLAQPGKIMQYKQRKHHDNSNSDLICITMSGWILEW